MFEHVKICLTSKSQKENDKIPCEWSHRQMAMTSQTDIFMKKKKKNLYSSYTPIEITVEDKLPETDIVFLWIRDDDGTRHRVRVSRVSKLSRCFQCPCVLD